MSEQNPENSKRSRRPTFNNGDWSNLFDQDDLDKKSGYTPRFPITNDSNLTATTCHSSNNTDTVDVHSTSYQSLDLSLLTVTDLRERSKLSAEKAIRQASVSEEGKDCQTRPK